jgi:hypothetical protein
MKVRRPQNSSSSSSGSNGSNNRRPYVRNLLLVVILGSLVVWKSQVESPSAASVSTQSTSSAAAAAAAPSTSLRASLSTAATIVKVVEPNVNVEPVTPPAETYVPPSETYVPPSETYVPPAEASEAYVPPAEPDVSPAETDVPPDENYDPPAETHDSPDSSIIIEQHEEPDTEEQSKPTNETDNSASLTTCLNPSGNPQPMILMTLGRSGSSSTWQILGNLTGYETYPEEYTGESGPAAKEFFNNLGPNEEGNWVTDFMCEQQALSPNANLVGFKWKPHPAETLEMPAAANGLQRIATLGTSNTPIKIVRSRRNIVDVLLSELKHKVSEVPSHCLSGWTECLEKHMESYSHKLTIPDMQDFYATALQRYQGEDKVDQQLKDMGVPTVFVSYDILYFPDTPEQGAAEWNKIVKFLVGDSATEFTWMDVNNSMKHALTTASRKHADVVENFDELAGAFIGGPMEHLIRT